MKNNFLTDKLEELYKRETYSHPLQFRTKPDKSITGEEPDEDNLGRKFSPGKDEEETKKDLGKGSMNDLGTGDKKDIGTTK